MIEIKSSQEIRQLLSDKEFSDDYYLAETNTEGRIIKIKLVTDKMLIDVFK